MRRPLINEPDDLIAEALEGLALAHPRLLSLDPEHAFVSRRTKAADKVGLVSGGGSGHEPLHAGFVGAGMLDVAVAGAVFASPTALQILEGTRAADSGAGVIQIVKNYTGDVLNFRIAGEFAGDDDVATEIVLVDDDLATESEDGPGRRGTGATVFVEKIAGAAAERGLDLVSVAEVGRGIAERARSMSLALTAGTLPHQTSPQFDLPRDEVELGVGIHGERGVSRIPFAGADRLVEELAAPLERALGLNRGSRVILLVNGMGGTYPLEIQVATRAAHRYLTGRGIVIERVLAGSFVTSLDMHGVSLSILPVDDATLDLWDAPVTTAALNW